MEFLRERVYTSLNADELRAGDKVIVANTMANLREDVRKGINIDMLREVHGEDCLSRFIVKEGWFPLAYLVERAENCTNCEELGKAGGCCPLDDDGGKTTRCWLYKPKTEQKAEKHYRPFRDTDELIKAWEQKFGKVLVAGIELTMPLIWVQSKGRGSQELIVAYNGYVFSTEYAQGNMERLLEWYTFLDGSPCGVEE